MAKKTWQLTVDGVNYNIEFNKKIFKKSLLINGENIPLEKSKTLGTTSETHFSLGNKTAVLVTIGNKVDLAFDGVYMNSGKRYVPIGAMPKWVWIFIILNVIPIITLSIISLLLAFFAVTICIRSSLSHKISIGSKLFICVLTTMISYVIFFLSMLLALANSGLI